MNKKILIATSNDDHRYLLTVIFKEAGYEVDSPQSLSDCTLLFAQNDYFKIIIDYDYRIKENRIFCSYLEANRYLQKSVVIQAITDEDIMTRVYSQGGSVVNKPYDVYNLLSVVNS
jgi:DNA-binding response OmpR family regulator